MSKSNTNSNNSNISDRSTVNDGSALKKSNDNILNESVLDLKRYIVSTERERGQGVKFDRIRRITGYLTGNLNTWNTAKRCEERDRVKHSY